MNDYQKAKQGIEIVAEKFGLLFSKSVDFAIAQSNLNNMSLEFGKIMRTARRHYLYALQRQIRNIKKK